MVEVWKDIKGYEGRYQVSSLGRVKALSFPQRYLLRNGVEAFRQTKEKLLAVRKGRHGYVLVSLHLDNIRRGYSVHSLVARAFLHGSGATINHKDGDKENNCVGNLEWATYAENLNHAVDLGLNRQAIRVRSPRTGRSYPSINRAAREERVSPRTVRGCFLREVAP